MIPQLALALALALLPLLSLLPSTALASQTLPTQRLPNHFSPLPASHGAPPNHAALAARQLGPDEDPHLAGCEVCEISYDHRAQCLEANDGKVSINNQWKLPIDACVCDTELLQQMARCFECSESGGLSSLHDLNQYGLTSLYNECHRAGFELEEVTIPVHPTPTKAAASGTVDVPTSTDPFEHTTVFTIEPTTVTLVGNKPTTFFVTRSTEAHYVHHSTGGQFHHPTSVPSSGETTLGGKAWAGVVGGIAMGVTLLA